MQRNIFRNKNFLVTGGSLLILFFSLSIIYALVQRTSWVSDDWYGSRVAHESLTAPVYSHYAPGSITIWRFFSKLGMSRTLWSLFVVVSIFLIWLGTQLLVGLYKESTWIAHLSLIPLFSGFGTYSLLYAAKGESSLPGAILFIWSTYFLHRGIHKDKAFGSFAFSSILSFTSFFFWETNLLFPLFSLLSIFFLVGIHVLKDVRVKFFLLVTIFSWSTYFALYLGSGAGSAEVKSEFGTTLKMTLNLLGRMFLPIFGGWPFRTYRSELLSPFAMASQNGWWSLFGLVISLTIFLLLVLILGRRFIFVLMGFLTLVIFYFLPIARERGGIFGDAIFRDFRYTSDLIGPIIIGVSTVLIGLKKTQKTLNMDIVSTSTTGKKISKIFLSSCATVALLGAISTSISSYEIYRTSFANKIPTYLKQLDEGIQELANCEDCVLLDSVLPGFFGTVGIPWNTVNNLQVSRGKGDYSQWKIGNKPHVATLDGNIKSAKLTIQRLVAIAPNSSDCLAGLEISRRPQDQSNLWTARVEIFSSMNQEATLQVNTVKTAIKLEKGKNIFWYQSFAGADIAVVKTEGSSGFACLKSLESGIIE